MSTMRAKFYVTSVETFETAEKLNMSPVTSRSFGPNGESEDNTYARYSPSGSLTLTVTNPDLVGTFRPGQKFYLDFIDLVGTFRPGQKFYLDFIEAPE